MIDVRLLRTCNNYFFSGDIQLPNTVVEAMQMQVWQISSVDTKTFKNGTSYENIRYYKKHSDYPNPQGQSFQSSSPSSN